MRWCPVLSLSAPLLDLPLLQMRAAQLLHAVFLRPLLPADVAAP